MEPYCKAFPGFIYIFKSFLYTKFCTLLGHQFSIIWVLKQNQLRTTDLEEVHAKMTSSTGTAIFTSLAKKTALVNISNDIRSVYLSTGFACGAC